MVLQAAKLLKVAGTTQAVYRLLTATISIHCDGRQPGGDLFAHPGMAFGGRPGTLMPAQASAYISINR